MAARERDKPAAEQHNSNSNKLLQQSGPIIRAQPVMVLRAVAAVAVCAAVICCCYLYLRGVGTVWWILAAAELAFCVHYWCCSVPCFTNLAGRQGPQEHDARFIKQRLLEQLFRVDDIMACMESWFLEAGPGDVKRDNLKELFAYAIWYRSLGEMEAEGLMPELDDLMDQLDRKYGKRLPQGYNPNLRFMSHLWEPLRHMYRTLVVYICMELLTLLCHVALLATGFRLRQLDGITYYTYRVGPQRLVPAMRASLRHTWSTASMASSMTGSSLCGYAAPACAAAGDRVRRNSSSCNAGDEEDVSQLPIVFLHGVGAGLLPYLTVVFRLVALGQPMILPHSKHVSMRLVSWIPTVDDMADATAAMLAVHGYSRAAVLGHSYGTMVASRLVMKYPQLVHSMCLTDPVCFAMFMPNLLRNFMYVQQHSGCWWLDLLLRFVASELHCCTNFSRKFFWSSINLWDEHIPDRTLVVLGGKDILSPAAQVDRWLREHTHAHVMFEPSMAHAGMLLSMDWQAAIVSAFVDIMHRPAASAQQPAADLHPADATVRVTAAPAAAAATASKVHAGSPVCSATWGSAATVGTELGAVSVAGDAAQAASRNTAAVPQKQSVSTQAQQAAADAHCVAHAAQIAAAACSRDRCSHAMGTQSCSSNHVPESDCLSTEACIIGLDEDDEGCGLRRARSSPLQRRRHSRKQQQQHVRAWLRGCGEAAGAGAGEANFPVKGATRLLMLPSAGRRGV